MMKRVTGHYGAKNCRQNIGLMSSDKIKKYLDTGKYNNRSRIICNEQYIYLGKRHIYYLLKTRYTYTTYGRHRKNKSRGSKRA
jgi:hypothetical protein